MPTPPTCRVHLLAASLMLAAVRSDNCTTVLDNLNCFNASSECLQFVSVNCPEGPSADNFECCSPAYVAYAYMSKGVAVETSDLIDLEQCTFNKETLVPNFDGYAAGNLIPYAPAVGSCSNVNAVPQLISGPSCASGFLCDFNISLCDMSTWPQYCSPDSQCSLDLLKYQYCDSQMEYEPTVCQPGNYCTRKSKWNAPSKSYVCPAGNYCILGTENPVKCSGLVHCKEGASNPVQYGSWVAMFIVDAILLGFMRHRQASQRAAQQSVISRKTKAKFKASPSSGNLAAPLIAESEIAAAAEDMQIEDGGNGGHAEKATTAGAPTGHMFSSDSSTQFLVRGFTRARGRIFSLDFTFDKLGLILPNGNPILQSVSARVAPGCVTAIMGPSGAGKTTLLNTLMGKQPAVFKQTGELRINGKIQNIKDFRAVIGFVPQDDIMIRELTVRDNIEYSARVRLPPSWTNEDIALHVDAVLDALSLAHVQHTRIGDEKTRGVSGGQRKRVNIGIEVSACPVALYLDEPTSGLDSTAALEVTNSLKHIAHSTGITVAMVIHQPRYEIWAALDEVLFLAPGGRTVYLGNLAAVQDYFFNQLGYMPTERDNPADFYMDRIAESGDVCVKAWADHVSSGHASRLSRADSTPPGGIAPPWSGVGGNSGSVSAPLLHVSEDLDTSGGGLRMTIGSGVNSRLHHFTDHGKTMKAKDLERALEDAGVFGDLKVQANLLIEAYDTEGAGTLKGDDLEKLVAQIDKDERGAPFWKQCAMAHTRSVVQQLNNPVAIAIELGTVSLAGALMGFAAKNPYTGILVAPYTLLSPANQVVLVPMSAMFTGMAVGLSAAPTGVNSFGSELVVYWREASVGHSQLAYFLGKTVSNFYRILIGALHFCAWYLLLAETILSPSQLYGVVVVLFFSVYGMACIISMLMPIDTANLVAVVLALLVPVFGGFVRNLGIGVKKTMYSWWANEAFFSYSIEPYKHLFYVDMTSDVWSYTLYQTEKDLLVVVLIGILCRIVAFFCMTGLNREKQS